MMIRKNCSYDVENRNEKYQLKVAGCRMNRRSADPRPPVPAEPEMFHGNWKCPPGPK